MLRQIFSIALLVLTLAACNAQATEPLPTLVPTIELSSPSRPEDAIVGTVVSSMPPYSPTLKQTSCEALLEFEINSDAHMECGFVTVPEDRSGDVTDTIQLAVVQIFHNNPTSNAAPLIFLPGGPGGPAIDYVGSYYNQLIAPLRAEHDVILFDPRGVGHSEPNMDCWGIKLTYLRDLAQDFSEEERAVKYLNALSSCQERLEEDGVNLAAYHSESIAADVRDILQVLGYEKAHLFGVSYGTRLAQQVMQDYPEWAETAVLDSVVPMSTQAVTKAATWPDEARQNLFASCANQPDCQANYPDLETVYLDLQISLQEDPIPLTFNDPVLGTEIEIMANPATLEAAMQWAVPNSYLAPLVPKMLHDLRNGDATLLKSAVSLPLLTYEDISLGMMISVLCHDQVSSLSAEQLVNGPEAYPQLSILNTVSFFDNGRFLINLCDKWGALAAEPVSPEPVRSNIPTLILAGERDTTTPPTFGQSVAETLSQSYFIEVPEQGHVPSFGPANACLQEIILTFLHNPGQTPVYNCQIEETEIKFYAPYSGNEPIALTPFTNSSLPFTIMVPEGWRAGESNHFYWLRYSGDVAQFAVQASPVSVTEWLDHLVENYAGTGLEEYPEYDDQIGTIGRTWLRYHTTFDGHPVTFLFTEESGLTYHVAYASIREEHAALYINMVIPALDSITLK